MGERENQGEENKERGGRNGEGGKESERVGRPVVLVGGLWRPLDDWMSKGEGDSEREK